MRMRLESDVEISPHQMPTMLLLIPSLESIYCEEEAGVGGSL